MTKSLLLFSVVAICCCADLISGFVTITPSLPQSQPRLRCNVVKSITRPRRPERFTCHTLLRASSSSETPPEEDDTSAAVSLVKPPLMALWGTLSPLTLVGCLTSAVLIQKVCSIEAARLFRQHVIGASLGTLVFLPSAVGAVRHRVGAVQAMKSAQINATTRRDTLVKHIYAHFYLTYAAAISVAVALVSIFRHKQTLGKPHFLSTHSRVGLAAAALWAGSYIVAQTKVWTPMLKKRNKEGFKYAPNLLWASKWHRKLGAAAAACFVGATATGFWSWGGGFAPTAKVLILAGILLVEASFVVPPLFELRKRAVRRQRNKQS